MCCGSGRSLPSFGASFYYSLILLVTVIGCSSPFACLLNVISSSYVFFKIVVDFSHLNLFLALHTQDFSCTFLTHTHTHTCSLTHTCTHAHAHEMFASADKRCALYRACTHQLCPAIIFEIFHEHTAQIHSLSILSSHYTLIFFEFVGKDTCSS